jgi:catechol 2,3-dioxygenase-like lactoylglutathione lyase family enzyme
MTEHRTPVRTLKTFVSVTPMVPAGHSLDEALKFYVGHLGFHVVWQGPGAAGIERDGVSFNLIQNDDRHWAENSSYSIGVHGLVALYDALRDVPARVGALEPKAWGRTEFHMVLPSGVCLQFYEAESLDA